MKAGRYVHFISRPAAEPPTLGSDATILDTGVWSRATPSFLVRG